MNFYDIKIKNSKDEEISLEKYKGKVLVVVNTAPGCGFAPQYNGLEMLYKKYHDKGLEILDFPCNQFGSQAPGTDEEIHNECKLKYDTSYEQMKKIDVNGENEEEIYTYLKSKKKYISPKGLKDKIAMKAIEKISKSVSNDSDIRWNFTKFLVDGEGNVIERYEPTVTPEAMEDEIVKLLKK